LDQCHIQRWKPSYKSSIVNLTQCHGEWSLKLRQDGRLIQSVGEEAYPLKKDPTRTVESFSPNSGHGVTADSAGEDAFSPLEHLFQNHLAAEAKQ